jgi:RNA polymerase sigma-70 factor (family 1)
MRHANTNDLQGDHLSSDDNNTAYDKVFEQNAKALWTEAYRLLRDDQAAKDIVQELFIEIWEKRSLKNVQSTVRSYLFQSLRYKCFRSIRTHESEEVKKSNWSAIQDNFIAAENRMERSQLQAALATAVDNLPAQCSTIMKEVYYEGRKRKEVAEMLGISVNTVNVHIHTACKKLQEAIKKYSVLD